MLYNQFNASYNFRITPFLYLCVHINLPVSAFHMIHSSDTKYSDRIIDISIFSL